MSDTAYIERRIEREIKARKAAERILEEKALELHRKNQELKELNEVLEAREKERTQQLEQSRKAYKNLVEKAGDIIYNLDDKGCFTYVNPVAEDLLRRPLNDIIGRQFSELVVPSHREEVVGHYLEQIRSRSSNSYLEFPAIRGDDSIIWLGQKVDIQFEGERSSDLQ